MFSLLARRATEKTMEYDIVDEEKFYSVFAHKDNKTKIIFKKPHGFIFPHGNGTINITLIDKGDKVYKRLSYKWNNDKDENKLKFFDAGKYTMNVTVETSDQLSLFGTVKNATKRVIGTSNKIDISLNKGETAQVLIYSLSEDQNIKFKAQQTDTIFEMFDFTPLGSTDMIQPMALESLENSTISGIFKVAQEKSSGKVEITSNSNVNSISSYSVSETPVFAKGQQSVITEVKYDTDENESNTSDSESSSESSWNGNVDGNGAEEENANGDEGGINRNSTDVGMIVGIVVAAVAVVSIVGVISFMAVKKKGCFSKSSDKSMDP